MAQARLTAGQRQGVTAMMGLLSREALLELRSLIDTRLAEIAEPEEPGQEEAQRLGAQQPAGAKGKSQGGKWPEIKTIHGRKYEYERWREGDVCRSRYIGPAK